MAHQPQQALTLTTEDVQGLLPVEYSLGKLSVADMRLVAWLLGRWKPGEPDIAFTYRGCSAEMGLEWHGGPPKAIKEQLARINGTRFKGRVFNATKGDFGEVWFGILDTASFREKRKKLDGVGEGTAVGWTE